jgi:integrase
MNSKNEELLERYFESRELGVSNRERYSDAIKSWEKYVGAPLEGAGPNEVKKWLNEARVHLKSSSIDLHGQRLRTLLNFASGEKVAGDAFEVVPFTDLRRAAKKANSLRDKLVTKEEFEKLLAAAKSPRVQCLLTMLYDSGCRKGELLSLKIRDIEFGDEYTLIHVKGKTGERAIPLVISVPYLRAWLQVHPDRQPDQHLFAIPYMGKLRHMSGVTAVTTLRDISRRAGTRMINPHMLRHTRLTELAKAGVGEAILKSYAGWTQGSVQTQVYLHLSGRDHIDPILAAQGLAPNNREPLKPIMEIHRCPKCDAVAGDGMIYCSKCGYILDEKLRLEAGKNDKVAELEARLKAYEEQQGKILKLLESKNVELRELDKLEKEE